MIYGEKVKAVRMLVWKKKHPHPAINYLKGSQAPIDNGSDWDPTG
jgi:hypothetical protein